MNIQVKKEQIDNIIPIVNCIKLSSYTTAATTIAATAATTLSKIMNVKLSENISVVQMTTCQKGISAIS